MANRSALGPGFCTKYAVLRGAEHWAIVPPSLSTQLQRHGPLPLRTEAVPMLQRLIGALLTATLFDEPHKSLTGEGGGAEDADEPAIARVTETSTSMVELPGTLFVAPDTISEKKSRP